MSGKNRLFKSDKTIRGDFCRSRISAGFGKNVGFWPEPEPKSGTALVSGCQLVNESCSNTETYVYGP